MRRDSESGIALAITLLVLSLISMLLVGFSLSVMTDTKLGGIDRDYSSGLYAAHAGMEKLTADLGTLFESNYSPTSGQINALLANPPSIPGVSFGTYADNTYSGYTISYPMDGNGNPQADNRTILSGAFQGMTGLLTPYSISVTSQTFNGSEVRLLRTMQTVGIPVFQFGIFSQTDLSFFAGSDFNFGGRVHTNGNLYLAEGSGGTLTMSDRVTAAGEVIRTNLSNGYPTATNYTGTVKIATSTNNYRALGADEGSLQGTLGSAANEPTWTNLSIGTYNGNIRSSGTGAHVLNLPLVGDGAQPIDPIRLPLQNEDSADPSLYQQRLFTQASVRILLADTAAEITNLPGATATAPVDLSTLHTGTAPAWYTVDASHPPIALSPASAADATANGYWASNNEPVVTGFLKIEIRLPTTPATWKDVTQEILSLGFAGRDLTTGCTEPNPDAVIRIERLRSDLHNNFGGGLSACGNGSVTPSQYAPNVLFDTREALFRDVAPAAPNDVKPALGGVMHYVELDVNNLCRWLRGVIPAGTSSGPSAFDPANSTVDFAVYFSDRRGERSDPTGGLNLKTGDYGFYDFVNPLNADGAPNGTLDAGEDLIGDGVLRTYGQNPSLPGNLTGAAPAGGIVPSAATRPSTYVTAQEAEVNRALFFRRALKVVNGGSIQLGNCPDGEPCGLTIVSENPAYVQGNFNSDGTFTGNHVAASVIADAVTLLSNNWNDLASFASPYAQGGREATTTSYRMAVVAGKGISFPQPAGTAQDFGTDGGVHNFLRYLEDWGGQTLNYRGSIASLFYDRQAVGTFKCCTTVYSPPTRVYNFDTDFLQPTLLPPLTPMFRDLNVTGYSQQLQPTP
jgi:hypothetical protein